MAEQPTELGFGITDHHVGIATLTRPRDLGRSLPDWMQAKVSLLREKADADPRAVLQEMAISFWKIQFVVPDHEVAEVIHAGENVFKRVTDGFGRISVIKQVFETLPAPERVKLLKDLARTDQGPQGADRLSLLTMIMSNDVSDDLDIASLELSAIDLPQLVNDRTVLEIVSVLADYPKEFRFQLAALLTMIPVEDIPEQILKKVRPVYKETEITPKLQREGWDLCSDAEPRLVRSINNGSVVIVNDELLTKFTGLTTALCLKTFTAKDGFTFVAGNWYSPTQRATHDRLRTAYEEGRTSLRLETGEWALMRPLQDDKSQLAMTAEAILELASQYAAHPPAALPDQIEGFTRHDYWATHME